MGGWINGIRQTVRGRGSCLNFATESFEDVAVNVRQTGEMEFQDVYQANVLGPVSTYFALALLHEFKRAQGMNRTAE